MQKPSPGKRGKQNPRPSSTDSGSPSSTATQPATQRLPVFTVLAVHPMTNTGNLRAFVDVCISGVIFIYRCRWIDRGDGKPYLQMPQEQFTAAQDGQTQYRQLIALPRQWTDAAIPTVAAAYFAKITGGEKA